ncbi:MAG: M48 family metallopeptidase [Fretibacterium sp.]|nr:M48 family metallopeptidase [Fretibacterium sp.]
MIKRGWRFVRLMAPALLVVGWAASLSPAWCEISAEVVEAAWKRIATTDGFKVVPINYEKDTAPNAWVKFKSQDEFSVHVTQGLMKILSTEEEIAGVLGHEIGHVRCGHYNEGVQRNVGWTILGAVLGRAGGLAQAAGTIGINLAESGFSRGQEVEADDYGTDLLVKAGYSPWGLYNAMKSFKDNNLVTQPSGFNSHPPTERRLQHLSDRAKSLEKAQGKTAAAGSSANTKKKEKVDRVAQFRTKPKGQ